jgi:hypothetical protein
MGKPPLIGEVERWRLVLKGYYEVSSFGRVRRAKPGSRTWVGRLLKPGLAKNGSYYYVCVTVDRKWNRIPVHILVAEAFLGPCPKGKEVNHDDGDKLNNYFRNLEYLTHAKNMQHAIDTGLRKTACGEQSGSAKLTAKDVKEIRAIPEERWHRRDGFGKRIAKKYGVCSYQIVCIRKRKYWKSV